MVALHRAAVSGCRGGRPHSVDSRRVHSSARGRDHCDLERAVLAALGSRGKHGALEPASSTSHGLARGRVPVILSARARLIGASRAGVIANLPCGLAPYDSTPNHWTSSPAARSTSGGPLARRPRATRAVSSRRGNFSAGCHRAETRSKRGSGVSRRLRASRRQLRRPRRSRHWPSSVYFTKTSAPSPSISPRRITGGDKSTARLSLNQARVVGGKARPSSLGSAVIVRQDTPRSKKQVRQCPDELLRSTPTAGAARRCTAPRRRLTRLPGPFRSMRRRSSAPHGGWADSIKSVHGPHGPACRLGKTEVASPRRFRVAESAAGLPSSAPHGARTASRAFFDAPWHYPIKVSVLSAFNEQDHPTPCAVCATARRIVIGTHRLLSRTALQRLGLFVSRRSSLRDPQGAIKQLKRASTSHPNGHAIPRTLQWPQRFARHVLIHPPRDRRAIVPS